MDFSPFFEFGAKMQNFGSTFDVPMLTDIILVTGLGWMIRPGWAEWTSHVLEVSKSTSTDTIALIKEKLILRKKTALSGRVRLTLTDHGHWGLSNGSRPYLRRPYKQVCLAR